MGSKVIFCTPLLLTGTYLFLYSVVVFCYWPSVIGNEDLHDGVLGLCNWFVCGFERCKVL